MTKNSITEDIQRIQSVLYKIIKQAVASNTVEELLEASLDELLSMPWFNLQKKGGFFLKVPGREELKLVTYRNVGTALPKMCALVPYGRCLCGIAAQQREIVYKSCVDDDHHNHPEGMKPHGHYNVPLLWKEELLGVLFLYLPHGHKAHQEEKEFITRVGQVIAQTIYRKQSEQKLQEAYDELQVQEEEIRQQNEELKATNDAMQEMQDQLNTSLNKEKELRLQMEQEHQEMKELQHKILHAEKMSSLGQLTAGVAHEINNPINFISGGAQSLSIVLEDISEVIAGYESLKEAHTLEDLRDRQQELLQLEKELDYIGLKEDVKALVKDIAKGIERVQTIVKSLQLFSNINEDSDFLTIDLVQIMRDSINVIESHIPSHIEVVLELPSEELPISCLPTQLGQVFVSLISNAAEAMEEHKKGTLIQISIIPSPNSIVISVKDDGPGMSKAVQKKLFDPFFSTKPVGSGKGLGLSMAYGIIEKHNGKMRLNSKLGTGTTFSIEIPRD